VRIYSQGKHIFALPDWPGVGSLVAASTPSRLKYSELISHLRPRLAKQGGLSSGVRELTSVRGAVRPPINFKRATRIYDWAQALADYLPRQFCGLKSITAAVNESHDATLFDAPSSRRPQILSRLLICPEVPTQGDRVLISHGTTIEYDAGSKDVICLIRVVGTLRCARDRDTELNVGLVKVQNSDARSESGFACDFRGANQAGEPSDAPGGSMPALLVGEPEAPILAEFTAKIRLHYLDGMSKDDTPAIACCSARLEFHGAPLKYPLAQLAADAKPGDNQIVLAEAVDRSAHQARVALRRLAR
jgi:hypothetical protein